MEHCPCCGYSSLWTVVSLSLGLVHCAVFFGKTLTIYTATFYKWVLENVMLVVILPWTNIPSQDRE